MDKSNEQIINERAQDIDGWAHSIEMYTALRPHVIDAGQNVVKSIADFCAAENPRFNRERFYAAVNGENAPTPAAFYQHWRAPNSPNGNPQRLYVVFDARGNVLRVVDEGYRGLPTELRGVPELPSVAISRRAYHMTKNHGVNGGI